MYTVFIHTSIHIYIYRAFVHALEPRWPTPSTRRACAWAGWRASSSPPASCPPPCCAGPPCGAWWRPCCWSCWPPTTRSASTWAWRSWGSLCPGRLAPGSPGPLTTSTSPAAAPLCSLSVNLCYTSEWGCCTWKWNSFISWGGRFFVCVCKVCILSRSQQSFQTMCLSDVNSTFNFSLRVQIMFYTCRNGVLSINSNQSTNGASSYQARNTVIHD